MALFRKPSEEDIRKTNKAQRDFFSGLIHVFDPPLPEGVSGRLEKIVASADIEPGETVLDVGTGTGILVPIIERYEPGGIIACDLSETMLMHLKKQYPYVEIMVSDVRDLDLSDGSVDVVFLNACYPNIADKPRSFENISRMMSPSGRMVISHPMGKSFVEALKKKSPFPLDNFPLKNEAEILFHPYRFSIKRFVDEADLYILVAGKHADPVRA